MDDNEETTPAGNPEVYAVKQGVQGWKVSRRDFLTASALAAGALAAGCTPSLVKPTDTPTPIPSPSPTSTATNTPSPTNTPTRTPTTTPTARPTIEPGVCVDPRAHKDKITYLAMSWDESLVVSASKDGTIKAWSLPDVNLLNTLNVGGKLPQVALSDDGRMVAAIDEKDVPRVYSVPDFELLHEFNSDESAKALAFNPGGTQLVVAYDDIAVRIWSTIDGSMQGPYRVHESYLLAMAISPESDRLVTSGIDKVVVLWSYPQVEAIKRVSITDRIDRLVIGREGKMLFSHNLNGQISRWSLSNFQLIDKKKGDTFAVGAKDSFLFIGNADDPILMWDIKNDVLFQSILGHSGAITALEVSRDGSILAAGNDAGSLYFWSLPAGTLFSCPIDLSIAPPDVKGVTYEATDASGRTVTYTLPCGAPIPDGAVCVCNCVGGSGCACVGYVTCQCVGYSECSCVGHVVDEGSHYWYPN